MVKMSHNGLAMRNGKVKQWVRGILQHTEFS
jgi:hypothetical protein